MADWTMRLMFIQKGMQDLFMDMEDTIKHEMMEQKLKALTTTQKDENFTVFFPFVLIFFMVLIKSKVI